MAIYCTIYNHNVVKLDLFLFFSKNSPDSPSRKYFAYCKKKENISRSLSQHAGFSKDEGVLDLFSSGICDNGKDPLLQP